MIWTARGSGCWESDSGYRIAAGRVLKGFTGWRYCAFAPLIDPDEYDAQLKERYALGEAVPQRRPLLGAFDEAAQAREICDRHQSSGGNHGNRNEPAPPRHLDGAGDGRHGEAETPA